MLFHELSRLGLASLNVKFIARENIGIPAAPLEALTCVSDISVIDAKNPYYQITFKGIVKKISETNADEHIHSLAKKYLNQDKYPISNKETRVIVSIEPQKFYVMK